MKEHLALFPALVAFLVFGNAASRSLQMPVQEPQRAFGGQGLGSNGPGPLGEGLGAGLDESPSGLFGGRQDARQSAGFGTGPRDMLRRGGGAGSPGNMGSLGSGGNGGSDTFSFGTGGGFGRGPGSGGSGGFPGGLSSPTGNGGGLGLGSRSPVGNLGPDSGPGRGPGTGGFGSASGTGPGGFVSGGRLSGTRSPTGLPSLEGEFGSPSGPRSNIGNGLSTVANAAGDTLGSGPGVPGQRGSTPGPAGLPSSPGFSGLFPGQAAGPGSGSSAFGSNATPFGSGGTEIPGGSGPGGAASGLGRPPLELPGSPSGPTFGSGSGSWGAGQAGPGVSEPASFGGSGGPGANLAPFGGPGSPSSGTSGASGAGGSGVPAAPGAQGAGAGLGRPTAGGPVSANRRTRKPQKQLTETEKAAIGLGVTSSLFALAGIGAAIASAVQSAHHKNRPGKPAGQAHGAPSTPLSKPPCVNGRCRERRSIRESKVPAEILDSIPMDFERLY